MGYESLLNISSQAMTLILYLSFPVVFAAALIGFLLSVFQALTQLQDATMPMVVKIFACFAVLMVLADWMTGELLRFTINIFERIATI